MKAGGHKAACKAAQSPACGPVRVALSDALSTSGIPAAGVDPERGSQSDQGAPGSSVSFENTLEMVGTLTEARRFSLLKDLLDDGIITLAQFVKAYGVEKVMVALK